MIILRLIYNEHRDNRRLVDGDILLIKFYESYNRFNGDFFGGIYATRIANFLGVAIREDDIELPPAYLDFNAMVTTSLLRGMNHLSSID